VPCVWDNSLTMRGGSGSLCTQNMASYYILSTPGTFLFFEIYRFRFENVVFVMYLRRIDCPLEAIGRDLVVLSQRR